MGISIEYLTEEDISFCYVLLLFLVSLFFSNKRQKQSGSKQRDSKGKMGGAEGEKTKTRIYFMKKYYIFQ